MGFLSLPSTGGGDLVDDTSPQLGGQLDTNAFSILFSKGADVASTSTPTLLTDGNIVDITGTTLISGFTNLGVGAMLYVQFDGALVLQNGAALILPGGDDILTEAGDTALFIQETAGAAWRCHLYNRIAGEIQTLVWPVNEFTTDLTVPPAPGTYKLTTLKAGHEDYLAFDQTTEEPAYRAWYVPPEMSSDPNPLFRVLWTTALAVSGKRVAWETATDTQINGVTIDGTITNTSLVTDDTSVATANILYITAATVFGGALDNLSTGTRVVFRLKRKPSSEGGAPLAGDARALAYMFSYRRKP